MEDPSPEEIAERAAEIRAEWTPAETVRRLRWDWRVRTPEFMPHRVGDRFREPADD